MATTVGNSTSGGGILSSLTDLVFGDASAAGQMAVDNRSFSQKYGSWDSDRKKPLDLEDVQADLTAKFQAREAKIIKAAAGYSENGVPVAKTTGFTASRSPTTDSNIGMRSTGSNYATFAAMSGRIAA